MLSGFKQTFLHKVPLNIKALTEKSIKHICTSQWTLHYLELLIFLMLFQDFFIIGTNDR